MYHPHTHGVLDHAFVVVFLRIGGKPRRAVGPTLILVVQIIRSAVMRRMNHLSELEEYNQKGMSGPIQGLALERVLSILENNISWSMVSNAALGSTESV